MKDIRVSDMMQMQRALYEVHKEKWAPRSPENAREFMLFLMEEFGEAVAIYKKKGNSAIMEDTAVRSHFCEELADVLMYFTEVLLCYGITPDEFSSAYVKKHYRNMGRNYQGEYETMYET